MVDDEDFEALAVRKWQAVHILKNWYAQSKDYRDGKGTTIYMHKVILGNTQHRVVHRDHDGLNNVRNNLNELVSSTYRGVCKRYALTGVKWVAQIRVGRRCVYIGTFDEESDAAAAYTRAKDPAFVPPELRIRKPFVLPNQRVRKSAYRGVYKHSRGKKWSACRVVNGKYTYLGLFTTEEGAAVAYANAAHN